MAITRPKPRTFNPEDLEQLTQQTSTQEIKNTVVRSTDPDNFPVFDYNPGEKYLVYVPKHTVTGEDDEISLRMDAPYIHTLHPDKNTYIRTRCTRGLNFEALGLDGSCPACEAVSTGFDLAKAAIERRVSALPGSPSPEDKDNEHVKTIRSEEYRNKPVDSPNRMYTFPIIVIESETNNKGRLVPKVTDGEMSHRAMWYTISERAYEKSWSDVFESASDDVDSSTIGGNYFVLSFGKPDENGQPPSRRDAGRDFKPALRNISALDDFKSEFNSMTAAWTPAKAMETVVVNQIPDMEWFTETVGEIEADMKVKIDLFRTSGPVSEVAAGSAGATVSLDSLKGGGASAQADEDAPVGELTKD